MFKYIFCLIAILMQPIFAFLVFHKQEKQKAALKMPLVYLSGVYLVIQIFVFFKVCLKIPKDYQVYSYLLQGPQGNFYCNRYNLCVSTGMVCGFPVPLDY